MNDIAQKLLLQISDDQKKMGEDVSGIRADLNEHMRRTMILETEVKDIRKDVHMGRGALALITVLATILSLGITVWNVLHGASARVGPLPSSPAVIKSRP